MANQITITNTKTVYQFLFAGIPDLTTPNIKCADQYAKKHDLKYTVKIVKTELVLEEGSFPYWLHVNNKVNTYNTYQEWKAIK